jgi:catechol 2,3-dioxygenase-like lactoylglutathione lyase family enzyme
MSLCKHEHTHFTSPEPDKTAEFYTQVLGARITKEQVRNGRRIIDLELGGIPIRISNGTGADKNWKGPRYGLHHLGLAVDNIEEFTAMLKSRGMDLVVDINQAQPGVRTAFIEAPDNVLFEIVEER